MWDSAGRLALGVGVATVLDSVSVETRYPLSFLSKINRVSDGKAG